jgi:hypothetical protein
MIGFDPRRRCIALPVSPLIDMFLFLVAIAATILATDPQPMPHVSETEETQLFRAAPV